MLLSFFTALLGVIGDGVWLSNSNGYFVICRNTGLRAVFICACPEQLLMFCLNSCDE